MRRWPYVVFTAVVAAAVVAWSVPDLRTEGIQFAGGPGGGPAPMPSLSLDTLVMADSARIMVLAAVVTLLVQVYSTAYLGHDRRYRSYALLIVTFLIGMVAVVATDNLFVLLIGWELMGVCSYLLIGHWWEQPQARAGAAKAFLVTRFADIGLLLAIVVIGETYGTYRISGAWAGASEQGQTHATAIGLLVLLAVMGKSAQVPLHTWLPDAMPGPTPITALIHAATMVAAGVFLVARLLPLFSSSTVVMTTLAVVASVTMLLGAVLALAQADLKRALAWSTVSQLALMFAALAVGDADAGVGHLVSHGVFKALLFLGCGCLMHAVGTSALAAMGGLRTSMPVTFWTMTLGFASLAGVIPTVGLLSKDGVLEALVRATAGETPLGDALVGTGAAWSLLVVACLTSVLTAWYATRLWMVVFLGQAALRHDEPRAMVGPLVVLAAACLLLSLDYPVHLGTAALSTALTAVGIGAAVVLRGRDVPLLASRPVRAELGLDLVVTRAVPGVVLAAARTVDAVDADGIDAYPRAGEGAAGLMARGLGLLQSGRVQRYATVIAAGVLALVVLAVVVGR